MDAKRSTLRIASIAILFVFAIGLLAPSANAFASLGSTTYSWPSWWTGTYGTNDCDASYYNANNQGGPVATLFTVWRGIQVCGPRPQQGGTDVLENIPNVSGSGSYGEYMWECPELPSRYLRIAYGLNAISANGVNFATNYASAYPNSLQHFTNGVDNILPQEGDVVSFSSSDPNGHVAIVSAVNISSPGNATLSFVDQNGDPAENPAGTFQMTVSNYAIQDFDSYHATDWIHPFWSENSPSGNYDTINAISAYGSTAWVAGFENPSGTRQPVTYKFDGTQWTKYNPPSQGAYYHHDLNGIVVNSNGEAWAVGDYISSQWNTLVYYWSPSTQSWSKVQSDTPTASGNTLYGVTIDGAGNIYAVGRQINPSTGIVYPLIEKWNGSKFASQTITSPTNGGTLTSVSFSSSSNGWAVGSGCTSTGCSYIVYHYDGTSWSWSLGSSVYTGFTSVVALSDTEAWAVGGKTGSLPAIFHYTQSGGWQEDMSLSFPVGTTLIGISASGNSDLWIAGTTSGTPFTAHYNGVGWSQIGSPILNVYSKITGVSSTTTGTFISGYRSNSTGGWYQPYHPLVFNH